MKKQFNEDAMAFLLSKEGLAIIVLVIITLWFASFVVISVFYGKFPDNPEAVGDQFGAVNALFSGLAFAGIIYTILLQRRDLEMRREVLLLQKEELAGTREEFKIQNETLKQQRFENTFFQLLNAFDALVVRGIRCSTANSANQAFFKRTEGKGRRERDVYLQVIIREYAGVLEPLFDYTINILSFITNSTLITEDRKAEYIRTLSSFLTPQERLFLFIMTVYNRREDLNIKKNL